MAEYAGSSLYLKFGSTVLSADFRTFDRSDTADVIDASAGSDAFMTKLVSLADGKSSVELVAQTGGTALWAALAPGQSGTLEIGEEGTATGKPKVTVVAFVSSRSRTVPYKDVVIINADFEHTGSPTEATY